MCFDQPLPHDAIVNFKPVHLGNRPGVGGNVTDFPPEHVGVVARTAWLQRFGREPNPPAFFGINRVRGRHKRRQDFLVRVRLLDTMVHMKRHRRLDIKHHMEQFQVFSGQTRSDAEDSPFYLRLNGLERLAQ